MTNSYTNVKPLTVSYDDNGRKVINELPSVKGTQYNVRAYGQGTMLRSILKRISK